MALKSSSTVRENEVLSILQDAASNGKFGDFNVSAITGTRYDTGITTTMAATSSSDSKQVIVYFVFIMNSLERIAKYPGRRVVLTRIHEKTT